MLWSEQNEPGFAVSKPHVCISPVMKSWRGRNDMPATEILRRALKLLTEEENVTGSN